MNKLQKLIPISPNVVAHRGCHYANDSLLRPLENTLSAYEMAWSAFNFKYAECDVALTRDGELVLCHDESFERLALGVDDGKGGRTIRTEQAREPVTKLTLAELQTRVALKNGACAPTLAQVLTAAERISLATGLPKQLIVELKGNDLPAAQAVAKLLETNPQFKPHVGVVMSFSIESIAEYARINPNKEYTKSMLLTVAKSRREGPGEFVVDWEETKLEEPGKLTKVEIMAKSAKLDGLYVEFEPEFLTQDKFKHFCERQNHVVGVWGRARLDPDSAAVDAQLVAKGASFVNTDFPDTYFD